MRFFAAKFVCQYQKYHSDMVKPWRGITWNATWCCLGLSSCVASGEQRMTCPGWYVLKCASRCAYKVPPSREPCCIWWQMGLQLFLRLSNTRNVYPSSNLTVHAMISLHQCHIITKCHTSISGVLCNAGWGVKPIPGTTCIGNTTWSAASTLQNKRPSPWSSCTAVKCGILCTSGFESSAWSAHKGGGLSGSHLSKKEAVMAACAGDWKGGGDDRQQVKDNSVLPQHSDPVANATHIIWPHGWTSQGQNWNQMHHWILYAPQF